MNSRYILTRTCLSEGSLTVARHLQGLFPATLAGQPLTFVDEQGRDYSARMTASGRRLLNLGALYHAHNLDVNDVLMLSAHSEGRYRVECVVKPHTERLSAPVRSEKPAEPTRRVVVNATPHVREVRLERASASGSSHITALRPAQPPDQEAAPAVPASNQPGAKTDLGRHAARREPAHLEAVHDDAQAVSAAPETEVAERREPPRPGQGAPAPRSAEHVQVQPAAVMAPPEPALETVAEQLGELARLTGYQVDYLGADGAGPVRLKADLGQHGYDVMLALTEAETRHPMFAQGTYRALLTWEGQQAPASPRLTREALGALLDHARLAPLTPIDLRGYWNTASFDMDSVASLAELVSAHLVQRGTFTYVLGALAQQPAHSIVDPGRLSEKLGSGVNRAELSSILDTLCRAPFMALLPLPGGQYYLRADIPALLTEVSDYSLGIARRVSGAAASRARA